MDQPLSFVQEIGRLSAGPLAMVAEDHPALYRPALAVPDSAFGGPELTEIARQMWAILDGIPSGVGLAAPQVGLSLALILVDDEETRLTLVNPRPLDFGSLSTDDRLAVIEAGEGCLSLPGWHAQTRRPAEFGLAAQDLEGRPISIRGQGLLARIFTHELDHLRGQLYLCRMLPGSFGPDGSEPLAAIEYRAR